MPEGPELYKAAQFLNHIASQHIFKKIRLLKKPSEKHPSIPWKKSCFSLAGEARGKEIRITFTEHTLKYEDKNSKLKPETLNMLLTFGMAGRFAFTPSSETHKHSLLMFDTTDDQTFSFVDTRHFGRWILTDDWSPLTKRGPSIITEYELFRKHVLSSLDKDIFNKPICEVMLEQRYFSSIGNYLRAEILHRLDIDPYTPARSVLENLPETCPGKSSDILKLCHEVCWEVINLKGSGKPYDPDGIYGDHGVFEAWVRCYMVEGMGNSVDSKGRTMWHSQKYGKGKKVRHRMARSTDDDKQVKSKGKRSKKAKTEEIVNEKVKSENGNVNKNLSSVKTESFDSEEIADLQMKLEPDEQLDRGVIKRRSTRLKRAAEKNKEYATSAPKTTKPRKKVSTVTTSPYF